MINLKANNVNYDYEKVKDFLSIVFTNNEDVELSVENNVIIVSVTINGKQVTRSKLPVNIKDRDTLGWHSDEHNLCLLPLKNGKFIMKVGCNKNRAIRSLKPKES